MQELVLFNLSTIGPYTKSLNSDVEIKISAKIFEFRDSAKKKSCRIERNAFGAKDTE